MMIAYNVILLLYQSFQRNRAGRYTCISYISIFQSLYLQREICFKELAHMIMETEMDHNLPFVGGDIGELVVQFLSQPEGVKTRDADGISQSECRQRLMSQLHFFIRAFKGLGDTHPHWGWQSGLLSLSIQMLISSKYILTDTLNNNV